MSAVEANLDLNTPLVVGAQLRDSPKTAFFPYESFYHHILNQKKGNKSYRYFRSITRLQDNFPLAVFNQTGKKVDVWCSNDYVCMTYPLITI